MYYSIRHVTAFRYDAPVRQRVIEVRMQPRSEGMQRCLSFRLRTEPRAAIFAYSDTQGNWVHHFDIPNQHAALTITAQALVEMTAPPALPRALDPAAWTDLDRLTATDEYWDYLRPSRYARPTPLLEELARALDIRRRDDPLSVLRETNQAIHDGFAFVPQSTTVRSPIDDALSQRQGVCQDFAHIMIALARGLGIPCRYVSGYLSHRGADDRSATDATHAWTEALLPGLGWVGFDPTNALPAGERHIRVAVGRDYADVPPSHGIYLGRAEEELTVSVQVTPAAAPSNANEVWTAPQWTGLGSAGVQGQRQQQSQSQ